MFVRQYFKNYIDIILQDVNQEDMKMSSYSVYSDITRNDFIRIKYNKDKKSIDLSGVVKKIDKESKLLYILNIAIPFNDIVEINKIC